MIRKAVLFILLAAPFYFSACEKSGEMPHYHVRAVIAEINPGGGANGQLSLLHEAIPDFRNAAGNVVGMHSMLMKFDLAPGVSPEGLSVKDKVSVDFNVNWYGNPRLIITEIEKLDVQTVLDLEGYTLE